MTQTSGGVKQSRSYQLSTDTISMSSIARAAACMPGFQYTLRFLVFRFVIAMRCQMPRPNERRL